QAADAAAPWPGEGSPKNEEYTSRVAGTMSRLVAAAEVLLAVRQRTLRALEELNEQLTKQWFRVNSGNTVAAGLAVASFGSLFVAPPMGVALGASSAAMGLGSRTGDAVAEADKGRSLAKLMEVDSTEQLAFESVESELRCVLARAAAAAKQRQTAPKAAALAAYAQTANLVLVRSAKYIALSQAGAEGVALAGRLLGGVGAGLAVGVAVHGWSTLKPMQKLVKEKIDEIQRSMEYLEGLRKQMCSALVCPGCGEALSFGREDLRRCSRFHCLPAAPQEVAEAHVAWEAAELTRYDSSDPGATAAARVVVERLLLDHCGMPLKHRHRLWPLLLGCRPLPLPSLEPPAKVIEQIDADVPRTRHSLVAGRTADLRCVLRSLSVHRPEIGYAQGMNQLAAVFLKLGFDNEMTFSMMDALMQDLVPGCHDPDLHGLFRDTGVADILIQTFLPRHALAFESAGIEVLWFTVDYFLTLGSAGASLPFIACLWDLCFLWGPRAVFSGFLASLDLYFPLSAIKENADAEEQLQRYKAALAEASPDGFAQRAAEFLHERQAKNYLSLGLHDEVEESDDVPFSGMKLKPYFHLKKSEVLDQVKKMGFASDYHPQQKDFEKYPLEDILLLFDPSRAYGEKIVWCTTEASYNHQMERLNGIRQAVLDEFEKENSPEAAAGEEAAVQDEPDVNVVVRDVPKECFEWKSETAENTHEEVRAFTVQNSRPLLQMMITRARGQFGKSTKFSDSGENNQNCRPQKDHNFAPPKRELEMGIQAVKETRTTSCQTTWFRPVNKSTQYTPSDFLQRGADLGYAKVDELSAFLSNVSVGVEEALQTNETVDIFQEEFSHLGEEEAGAITKTHSKLKEHPNFHDVTYTKGKRIEWVEWVPNSSEMVVSSCCENQPFTDRLENSGKASVSTVLVWSFADSLSPHAILESPWEVTVFKFYPSDPTYLIGGLANGQVAVWKLSTTDLGFATKSQNSRPGMEEEKHSTIPTVVHRQISMIDESHRKAVVAIEFMPATLEIERRGRGASEKNPADAPMKYFLTVAGDGQVMIWDFQAMLDAINDNDFLWRPVHRVQLQRQDSGTEMGLCHILHCHDRFDDKGTKLLTNFYATTEEGELILGDWAARGEEDRKADVVKKMYSSCKTFRPMQSLERSPFFPDILLGVTDWAFYLFKDGLSEHLFMSSYTSTYYTRGVWSPTRPSVIFLGLVSGGIDIWDFSDQSHKASLSDTGASVAITSMMFCYHGDIKEGQKLAVGDAQGHLHIQNIPKNLIKPGGREKENMRKFLDREEKRVRYFQERQQELRELKEQMEKAAMAQDETAKDKTEDLDKEDAIAEASYQKLEAEVKEQL
ncbi:unnamed protein product, partial [Effrenium voratum]